MADGRTALRLVQGEKWIQITLLEKLPASWFQTELDAKNFAARLTSSGYTLHGMWILDTNSDDLSDPTSKGKVDPTSYKTIGSSAPQGQKFWRYAPRRYDLEFYELPTMTNGGGPDSFGKTEVQEQIAATLYDAWWNRHAGFYPLDQVKGSRGFLKITQGFLTSGTIFWQSV